MKTILAYALAATLAAGAVANPSHHHQHRHLKKNGGSKVAKRDPTVVVEWVNAQSTVYKLGNEIIDASEALQGLEDGSFVIVGESLPTSSPALPSTTSQDLKGQFVESKTSSSTSTPTPTTSAHPSSTAPSSSSSAPSTSSTAPQTQPTGTGINAEFPSGKISCSDFPSSYGAVPLLWLNFGGWAGIQFVPGYTSSSLSISDIVTGIAGQNCGPGAFCTYACPPPYHMAQWPPAQGSTGQSIGGLYCNSDGYLELTRSGVNTLCEAGGGGIYVQNDLSEEEVICATNYPGTEAMVVPTVANAGQELEICNPMANNSYVWEGKDTTMQYYINPKGVSEQDACCWTSPTNPTNAGNWAAAILGVGMDASGTTWIGLNPNTPTSQAILDFNIEITGDVSVNCSIINGKNSGGPTGCTTSVPPGGKATIRYF